MIKWLKKALDIDVIELEIENINHRIVNIDTQASSLKVRLDKIEPAAPDITAKQYVFKLHEEEDGLWLGPWKVESWSYKDARVARHGIPPVHLPSMWQCFIWGAEITLKFCELKFESKTFVQSDMEIVTAEMFEEEKK